MSLELRKRKAHHSRLALFGRLQLIFQWSKVLIRTARRAFFKTCFCLSGEFSSFSEESGLQFSLGRDPIASRSPKSYCKTPTLLFPRLVSELASEGASGRLFSQTQINKNATRCGPIYHRHVHFNLIETRIASCLFVSRHENAVTPNFGPNLIRFSIHLARYDVF